MPTDQRAGDDVIRGDRWRLALLLDVADLNCDDEVWLGLVNDRDHMLAREFVEIINEERRANGDGEDHNVLLVGSCWTAASEAEQAAVHISGKEFVLYLQGLIRQAQEAGFVPDVPALDQLREDAFMVLTVYDEHVPPENRGPWRDRLADFASAVTDPNNAPASRPLGAESVD